MICPIAEELWLQLQDAEDAYLDDDINLPERLYRGRVWRTHRATCNECDPR